MTSKKTTARKQTRKIAASRRVRQVVRPADAATADSGAIRFGFGSAPASLRK